MSPSGSPTGLLTEGRDLLSLVPGHQGTEQKSGRERDEGGREEKEDEGREAGGRKPETGTYSPCFQRGH